MERKRREDEAKKVKEAADKKAAEEQVKLIKKATERTRA